MQNILLTPIRPIDFFSRITFLLTTMDKKMGQNCHFLPKAGIEMEILLSFPIH